MMKNVSRYTRKALWFIPGFSLCVVVFFQRYTEGYNTAGNDQQQLDDIERFVKFVRE